MQTHRVRTPRAGTARSAGRLIGLGASALVIAAGLLATPAAAPKAAADDCPDVEVIFARGTNEPPGLGRVRPAGAAPGRVDEPRTPAPPAYAPPSADLVAQAGFESFPASDPPSWQPTAIGKIDRDGAEKVQASLDQAAADARRDGHA